MQFQKEIANLDLPEDGLQDINNDINIATREEIENGEVLHYFHTLVQPPGSPPHTAALPVPVAV